MAGETQVTVVGNLTADPDLRYTQGGDAVVNFTVAATPRTFDRQANEWKDGDALFLRCTAWKHLAEHVAGSLTKGARVIVQGRLRQRSFETREGEKRTVVEVEVDEVGPSLRYVKTVFTDRNGTERAQGAAGRDNRAGSGSWTPATNSGAQAGAQGSGGWAVAAPPRDDEETPF